jgi:hypothetical protein
MDGGTIQGEQEQRTLPRCGLWPLFLKEHDGANDGNNEGEGRGAFPGWLSLQGDDGKDGDGRDTGGRGEQRGGNKNKEEGHDVVCGLSFLREHNGANNGNDGGKGRGAFSMHPSSQGDDGKAGDGCNTGARGEQRWGNKNKEEGHNVVCALSFLREHNGANDGNDGGKG